MCYRLFFQKRDLSFPEAQLIVVLGRLLKLLEIDLVCAHFIEAVNTRLVVVEIAWIVPSAPLILISLLKKVVNVLPSLLLKHLHQSKLTFNLLIWSYCRILC